MPTTDPSRAAILARRMNRFSILTSPPSEPDGVGIRWALLDRGDRLTQTAPLGLLLAWFSYTKLYFFLHPLGLTFAPSLFMYLTGKPDPGCGLTRTFAWMWRGDLGRAVAVYPLGPLVFLLAAGFAVDLGIGVLGGRQLRLRLPRSTWRAIIAVSVGAVAVNWAAKLIWLGM